MSQDKFISANRYGALFAVAATVAFAASASEMPIKITDNQQQSLRVRVDSQSYNKSGSLMINYPHASENYFLTQNTDRLIDRTAIEMQTRYHSIKRSFMRYSEGFPIEKLSYFTIMANALCKLEFQDNVSSYNKVDESIDTILRLKNGLTLSVSSFVDEDEDAPMVFSLHRGQTLLVSDELPINEIVRTINSVIA